MRARPFVRDWWWVGPLALVTWLVPIALYGRPSAFILTADHGLTGIVENFGFTASAALLLVVAVHIGRLDSRRLEDLIPAAVATVVGLVTLVLLVEFPRPSWDYDCYQAAAEALRAGRSPYGECYLYPPLVAQELAAVGRALESAGYWLAGGRTPTHDELRYFLFYTYHAAQFPAALVALALGAAFVKRLGVRTVVAWPLVGALLVLNNAFVRTIAWNQVNLWVLASLLIMLTYSDRFPAWSGLAAALGVHLKIYPLLPVGALGLAGRRRMAAWNLAFVVAIVAVQTAFGTDLLPYQGFGQAGRAPIGLHLRDNSLLNLCTQTLMRANFSRDAALRAARWVTAVLTLSVLAWFAWRFYRRRREQAAAGANGDMAIAHGVDAVALMLLVSPVVWEHHALLALPLVFYAVIHYGRSQPIAVGLGAILLLALPTFDVFPFSFHRLAGLLILVAVTGAARDDVAENSTRDA